MTDVHLLVPAGYADPLRASGGNRYDGAVLSGLVGLGWSAVTHEVPPAEPEPDPRTGDVVERVLAGVPDGGLVVVDGLLATAAAPALLRHAGRVRLVALVHMPGPPGGPPPDVLRAAALVITTSTWTARMLSAATGLAPDRMVVAPPGVVPADLAPGTDSGGALLCVGAVVEAKGQDLLVAALEPLADRPWTCAVVGSLGREPGYVERQRQVLAAAGLADRVRLTGPLAGAELDQAYAAADLLVVPSRLESYGMVVTEALARGVPVVAAAVGGVPEALGRTVDGRRPGALVPVDDAAALGRALADWLDRPDRRAELRAAARARRLELTGWEHTAARIASALAQLGGR